VAVLLIWLLPPFGQDPGYHNFADTRQLLGIPNFFDVVSNLAFALVGIAGLLAVPRLTSQQSLVENRLSYKIFFIGVGFTSIGSAYYHLDPNNARLLWDRLPMTIGFMCFLSAMIGERVSKKAGQLLLFPLLVVGAASVLYWYWTESQDQGDLRFYLYLVQAYPMLLVVFMVIFFPSRYTHGKLIIVSILVYALAKLVEANDHQIFGFYEIVSGHTLKHLFAAVSIYLLKVMLVRRSSLNPQGF